MWVTPIPWKQFLYRPQFSKTVIEYYNGNLGAPNAAIISPNDSVSEEKKVGFKTQTELISGPKTTLSPDYLSTELVKASMTSKFKSIPPKINDGSYTLLFDIHDIDIKDHPLMTDEIRVAKECIDMISVLRERQKSGLVEFLDEKLTALKSAHMEFKLRSRELETKNDPNDTFSDGIYPAKPAASFYERHGDSAKNSLLEKERSNSEQNRNFLEDIRATRLLRDTEMQTNLILEFQILKKWESIKNMRTKQGFMSSNLKILVKTNETFHDRVISPL